MKDTATSLNCVHCCDVSPSIDRCSNLMSILLINITQYCKIGLLAKDVFGRSNHKKCVRMFHHSLLIIGTAGDTGSAAIVAVKGLPAVDIIVLLPRGRCTRLQELQMTTAIADNVHVFRGQHTSSCFLLWESITFIRL